MISGGCAECAKKDAVIAALEKALALMNVPAPTVINLPQDLTANCPCRPENGGSGVCGCILGGNQVIC